MSQSIGPGLARRRFPRRAFARKISILFRGKYYSGRGKEVGEGGMLIEIDALMQKGDFVLINFLLPISGITVVQAQVRSVRNSDDLHSYGLLFLNLDYEGKKGVREYIAAKSEEESKLDLDFNKAAS